MEIEYTSCPYCFSKKVKKEINEEKKRVFITCEECTAKIDNYPLEDRK